MIILFLSLFNMVFTFNSNGIDGCNLDDIINRYSSVVSKTSPVNSTLTHEEASDLAKTVLSLEPRDHPKYLAQKGISFLASKDFNGPTKARLWHHMQLEIKKRIKNKFRWDSKEFQAQNEIRIFIGEAGDMMAISRDGGIYRGKLDLEDVYDGMNLNLDKLRKLN